MEGLLLGLRRQSPGDLLATCGKVRGMSEYDRFFGPISGRLHATLQVSRARSAYYAGAVPDPSSVSGYHDDRTDGWVLATAPRRRALRVVDDCFERARDLLS